MPAKPLALVPVEHITHAILVLRGHKVLLETELLLASLDRVTLSDEIVDGDAGARRSGRTLSEHFHKSLRLDVERSQLTSESL